MKEGIMSTVGRVERRMVESGERLSVRKRIVGVMVEVGQNIVRHSDVKGEDEGQGVFVKKEDHGYLVVGRNVIDHAKVRSLHERLMKIAECDKNGLKELYRETLRSTRFSEKGGAGLGLIEIARRANGRLKWSFDAINERVSYFSLMVTVR